MSEKAFSDAPSSLRESPTPRPDLSPLIARVEAATGPDRDLNADLLRAFGWTQRLSGRVVGPDGSTCFTIPDFTASLDAALALVDRALPGWFVGLQQNRWVADDRRWSAFITLNSHEHEGTAPTPSLALILALLRALQEQAPA